MHVYVLCIPKGTEDTLCVWRENIIYNYTCTETCHKDHLYRRTTCLQRPLWTGPGTTKSVLLHLYIRTTCLQRNYGLSVLEWSLYTSFTVCTYVGVPTFVPGNMCVNIYRHVNTQHNMKHLDNPGAGWMKVQS